MSKLLLPGLALCLAALGACADRISQHGYIPRAAELAQINPGQDDRARVDQVIGAPAAQSMRDKNSYYYVRSTFAANGPRAPRVISREVVAISFDDDDRVESVARLSLEDGQYVPLALRVSEGAEIRPNYIAQIISRLGRFSAEDVFN